MYCRSCEEGLSILKIAPSKDEYRSDPSLHNHPTKKGIMQVNFEIEEAD